jgi:crossover junction endodeoxyribonuclease RuvC
VTRAGKAPGRIVVLGIDPGAAATGFGVIRSARDGLSLLEAGVLRSRPGPPLPERVLALCDQLEALLRRHAVDQVAVESLFHARNARSALTMAHVRGALLLTLARYGLPVAEYSPRTVKKAVTGYGAADKDQVRHMVARLAAGADVARSLDASDAVAVAICHAHSAWRPRASSRASG